MNDHYAALSNVRSILGEGAERMFDKTVRIGLRD